MRVTIYGIHHLSNDNIGDRYCRPWAYCSTFLPPSHRIMELGTTDPRIRRLRDEWVILGGGGLLHPWPWNEVIRPLLENRNRVIAWGIGHHHDGVHAYGGRLEHDWAQSVARYAQDYAPGLFALCGYRDVVEGFPYAPCCTCMHPAFDISPPREFQSVIYAHGALPPVAIQGMPRMRNTGAATLEEVAAFLGSAEWVITNSYHGAYWATLLGCRVLIYEPWCTKFALSPYPHVVVTRSNWRTQMAAAMRYPMALRECRSATLTFARQVQWLMGGGPRVSRPHAAGVNRVA